MEHTSLHWATTSAKLQKKTSDIYKVYGYIDFVTTEVQSMCVNVDEVQDDWFSEASAIVEHLRLPSTFQERQRCRGIKPMFRLLQQGEQQ